MEDDCKGKPELATGRVWSLAIQFMLKLQAFYPMNSQMVVNPGDILAARYDNIYDKDVWGRGVKILA